MEAFSGRFRAECLNADWFLNLADAAQKLGTWRRDYNEQRPHSAIGNDVPAALMISARTASPCVSDQRWNTSALLRHVGSQSINPQGSPLDRGTRRAQVSLGRTPTLNCPILLFKFPPECHNKEWLQLKVRVVTEDRNQRLGSFVETSAGGERVQAYVPAPLPPNPPLDLPQLMSV